MDRVSKKKRWIYFLAIFIFATAPAKAATLSFFCITGNLAADCVTGEAQLTVNVTDPGGNQVLFHFKNSGPNASSITDVYFDDGSLLGLSQITNGPGVSFSQYASPPNLPGANNVSPPFQVTAGFLADSNPPVQPNGVNPGEWLKIYFDLQAGKNFADVITDLTDGSLRIGLHVQGFTGGGSESFVNNPVPIPAAVWLFGAGLGLLSAFARRKK